MYCDGYKYNHNIYIYNILPLCIAGGVPEADVQKPGWCGCM